MASDSSSPWLDSDRGYLIDWLTQRWVQATGVLVDLSKSPWLAGPIGSTDRIGADFFTALAREGNPAVRKAVGAGLMESFASLDGPGFAASSVSPEVRDFYEHTSDYELDVWSQWAGAFRPFGRLLALLFSRRLQQLNVPLDPLSTAHGMSSQVFQLEDPTTDQLLYAGWVRENRSTGHTVYVGAYSVSEIPGHIAPCVKVVFPLPNGSATVIMRPTVENDGSLRLESSGSRIGDPGFYLLVRRSESEYWVRYLRTFREVIRVYCDGETLRTDHTFTLWRQKFLRLHYKLERVRAGA